MNCGAIEGTIIKASSVLAVVDSIAKVRTIAVAKVKLLIDIIDITQY
jgi:hypothetical protein